MSQFQKDKLTAQAEHSHQQSVAAFERWLKHNPQVVDCIANRRAFENYCDFTDSLVEADFDFCFSNIRSRLALQTLERAKECAADNETEEKASLINEIIRLLETGGARHTAHDLKTERTKLRFQSVLQLQARRDSIIRSQEAAGKSVSQLRAELAEARRDTRRYPGFPDMPAEIVPKGKVRAVRCDAKYLKSLDADTLREMCRRYSFPQINDAIRERIAE
jgi:hypothetical protein